MGASMEQGGTSRRRGARRQKRQPMAEINVTPFVDVMLVLLIIFMVTAPLLSTGVPVDLPTSEANASPDNGDSEPLTISVRANGSIFLQETETSLEEIVPKLTAITEGGLQQVVYVRADAQANYGALMRVMGKISGAGFQRISLVTDIEQN
ncbi:MAG: protein TolR [Rhodomicrobiaceae bacterium]